MGEKIQETQFLGGRDGQCGNEGRMLRSLGSSSVVALSHLQTQLRNCCNSWRIYNSLKLPQERCRRFLDSYNDGCAIFVALFLVGRLFASAGDQMRVILVLQGEMRNVTNIANR